MQTSARAAGSRDWRSAHWAGGHTQWGAPPSLDRNHLDQQSVARPMQCMRMAPVHVGHRRGSSTMHNAQEAAERTEQSPQLPRGGDERFAGYGVMGLPFDSGHVLAMRRFPASSVGPAYSSVWHR